VGDEYLKNLRYPK